MNSEVRSGLKPFEMSVSHQILISVVDDDKSVREAMKSLLGSVGFKTEVFSSAEDFLNSNRLDDTDCLILDVRMSGMSGLELQRLLNSADCDVPIIFISAHDDGEARQKGLQAGAIDFLQKPFSEDALLKAINMSLDRPRAEDDVRWRQ